MTGPSTSGTTDRVSSVTQKQYQAAAEAAQHSREQAMKALDGIQKLSTAPNPLQVAGLAAYQEQAKIDALHLISHDLNALREAIDSMQSR